MEDWRVVQKMSFSLMRKGMNQGAECVGCYQPLEEENRGPKAGWV